MERQPHPVHIQSHALSPPRTKHHEVGPFSSHMLGWSLRWTLSLGSRSGFGSWTLFATTAPRIRHEKEVFAKAVEFRSYMHAQGHLQRRASAPGPFPCYPLVTPAAARSSSSSSTSTSAISVSNRQTYGPPWVTARIISSPHTNTSLLHVHTHPPVLRVPTGSTTLVPASSQSATACPGIPAKPTPALPRSLNGPLRLISRTVAGLV